MRYLLDTHAYLWLAREDPRLPRRVIDAFVDGGTAWYLSAASVWEMAIKSSLGKLSLRTPLDRLVSGGLDQGVRMLDVESQHAMRVEDLPFHHRDPFDRLLVAQARHEGLQLVSRDGVFDAYGIARIWT